jgi:hypothetical protein
MLSQLEIKDPQQQAKADTISENDNEISLQEPIDYPGATPNAKIRNILRERSPADPVSQHFFSCGKYEKVVQTAAPAASARIETARRHFPRVFFDADTTEDGRTRSADITKRNRTMTETSGSGRTTIGVRTPRTVSA